jgi:trimethylamine--corrinoid protein Co-methyltransferase
MPIIYGFAATTSDMHNMSVSNASPGFAKQARYGALMAKRYGLACRSGGGMSDAGGLTAQAGIESAMSLFEAFSEKANFVMHATGSLQSFSTVNYEKFMLDLETIARMRYYFSELDCSDEALAFDALHDVIFEDEQFMFCEHTLKRCRTDPFMNTVSLHGRSRGVPNTELYVSCRAKLAYELEQYEKPSLDPAVERQLDDYMRALGMREADIRKV